MEKSLCFPSSERVGALAIYRLGILFQIWFHRKDPNLQMFKGKMAENIS